VFAFVNANTNKIGTYNREKQQPDKGTAAFIIKVQAD
jgi:hypothetical protein